MSATLTVRPVHRAIRDTLVLARRNMARTISEPESLIDVTVTPLVFTLLFAYAIGGAIALPGGASYHEYLIPGMFAMTLASAAAGTAVAVNTDMAGGVIDRFRSLPMSRSGVLAGQSLADLATAAIAVVVLAATGLAIGWRAHNGIGPALAAFGLVLLFTYALNWVMSCVGMLFRSAEGAQQIGVLGGIGLTFLSNAFVPTTGMPGWLRALADWNPVSALATACRDLFGNPNPAAASGAWPMHHAAPASALWSLALLAVFAPLAVRLYRTRSDG